MKPQSILNDGRPVCCMKKANEGVDRDAIDSSGGSLISDNVARLRK